MNELIELAQEEIAEENAAMDAVAVTAPGTAFEVLPPIHTSFGTAYISPDYPYGRRLRCKRAVWIEHNPRYGQRFVSRTTNPKRHGEVWNTPHPDGYNLAVVLVRDVSNGHIKVAAIHNVWDVEHTSEFLDKYSAGLDEETREKVKAGLRELIIYESHDRAIGYSTTTIGAGGIEGMTRQTHVIPAKFTQEEADRLLAKYATASRPAPIEIEPDLGPLFAGG